MVDSEQTGKKLLEKGELKRRVTIIPLNKISSRSLNDDVVKKAKKLVGVYFDSSIYDSNYNDNDHDDEF